MDEKQNVLVFEAENEDSENSFFRRELNGFPPFEFILVSDADKMFEELEKKSFSLLIISQKLEKLLKNNLLKKIDESCKETEKLFLIEINEKNEMIPAIQKNTGS